MTEAFFVQEYNQLIFLGLMGKPKYLQAGIRDAINEFDIKINEWERIKRGN